MSGESVFCYDVHSQRSIESGNRAAKLRLKSGLSYARQGNQCWRAG